MGKIQLAGSGRLPVGHARFVEGYRPRARQVIAVPTRRVMKSVLHNFLGTYTSRYSDFHGYWMLGQVPSDVLQSTIDLLEQPREGERVAEAARRLAVQKFTQQVERAGLSPQAIREATLQLCTNPEIVEGRHGDYLSNGHMVRFIARAITDTGHVFHDEATVFVAPHSPRKERRRSPEQWGY